MSENLGEVEVTLGSNTHHLRCTLRAARTISGLSGGFIGAFDGIQKYHFATYVQIIAAGLDKRTTSEVEVLEESVYQAGLEGLAAPLSRYLNRLMNGGRDPVSSSEASSGKG